MSNTTISSQIQRDNLGPIDNYLFGTDPESDYSLFSYDVSRVAPFSKNTGIVTFTESADFGKVVTASLPYLGDLLNTIFLHITLPILSIPTGSTYVSWTNAIGFAMIDYVEILIGDFVVSRQSGELMEILDYLSTDSSKRDSRYISTGRFDNINVIKTNAEKVKDIYVPFQFWFNKKQSASIPMTALSRHQVKIRIKFKKFQECVSYDGNTEPDFKGMIESRLLADYYNITKEEKENLKTEKLVYLIEQYQISSHNIQPNLGATRYLLNIENSIRELIIVARENESVDNNDIFNYGLRSTARQGEEFFKTLQLYMNGQSRFEKINESYWRLVTPQRHHTYSGNRNIYCIPFAENPDKIQPTGSANFTMYDNVELGVTFTENVPLSHINVFGISYNILTIHEGKSQMKFLS
jgi:hypothetical protein